jgi:hypothetical protein
MAEESNKEPLKEGVEMDAETREKLGLGPNCTPGTTTCSNGNLYRCWPTSDGKGTYKSTGQSC